MSLQPAASESQMAHDLVPLADVVPAYEALESLADERLDGPVKSRIRTWEDGEFEIRITHGYGPHRHRPEVSYHHVLRYHSGDDETVEALLEVDLDTVEKRLIHKETVDTDGVCFDAGRPPSKK